MQLPPMGDYSPAEFLAYIKECKRMFLAEYHARKAEKKPPPKPDYGWNLNKQGTFILRVRNRKPPYLTKAEYEEILKGMLAEGLTKGILDKTIDRRNIPIKEDVCMESPGKLFLER